MTHSPIYTKCYTHLYPFVPQVPVCTAVIKFAFPEVTKDRKRK